MIKSQHVTKTDLLSLLQDEGESQKTKLIGEHLHQCEECRNALDAITAQSEIWAKTPKLLKDSELSDAINPDNIHEGTLAFSPDQPSDEDSSWQYPFESLLDPPKHPEMMGRIGKYDVEREVGRGGMGIVLKAHDTELNRPLAIKILAPHLASHGTARKRFAQEARAVAGVIHPNVIAIYDVSNEGKTPYIVMPFVAGPSLQKLIDQLGPLSEIEIVRVALQIAAGLTPAHAQGLVHRDVKPANILVEQGVNRVIITDFGLARAEDDASLTRTGWLTGTPNYMSPEQTRGERLDHRSDLFSLGSLIYFLATGRLPFRSESPLGVLTRIQKDAPTPVRQVNPTISKTLAAVIDKLLKKDPGKRFQSAAELHDLLERHLAFLHQPDISKPPKVTTVTPNSRSRKWAIAVASLAILALALFGASGLGLFSGGTLDGESPGPDGFATVVSDDSDIQDSKSDQDNANAAKTYTVSYGNYFERDDKDGQAFRVGYDLFEAGEYEQALEKWRESVTSENYEGKSHYNIACVFIKLGQPDKAFAELEKAIHTGYADLDHYKKDSDLDSIRDDERFDDLLSDMEMIDGAYELIDEAKSLNGSEEYADAVKLFSRALKILPDEMDAITNLGYALHMDGKLDEAMKWHRRAAASKTMADLGNYNMACVYSLQGNVEQAIKHLDLAIDAGLADRLDADYLQDDSDLEPIRDDPRFKALLKEVKELDVRFTGMWLRKANGGSNDSFSLSSPSLDVSDDVKGTWESRMVGDEVYLTITRDVEATDWDWGYSSRFRVSDFSPAITKDSTEFRLSRPFGDLVFTGSFTGRKGKGEFHLDGDEKYEAWLKKHGIEFAPKGVLFRLFMSWQDEDQIVKNLKELQDLDLQDQATLGSLMIHGVKANLVRKYQKADLSIKDHLIFVIWRVKPSLILDYQEAGFDVVKHSDFINKRIPAKLLERYQEAGLDINEFEEFITWRVDAKMLKKYQAANLSLDKYKKFIKWRVSPELLVDYQEGGLDLDEHESFLNARVEPELVKSYQEAGFDTHEYKSYIQRRVPTKLLQDYRKLELNPKEYRSYVHARVAPEEIKSYQSADLFEPEYKSFLKNKVPAKLLINYKKNGFEPSTHKFFVERRVPTKLLQDYQTAGLDLEKHKHFIEKRMKPEKALKYLEEKDD